ncbi:hypothetical protein [Vibrio phage JSF13]|jgi:hypothetical protein|uniref:Uncharacterized protein ORF48 n=1 Tax=Vibrio phage ICP1 TaxID=979525 RepID=F1D170_9CAUD|nr:hypothetical protein ViPhICP1_gp048 [Vibrio phage ICP1]ADX88091.1 hypothetical protein TUST1-191_00225 [Vibrio phage ICP1_2006_D]ADX88318.1 hypothetical protein TUST1-182_00225 [Vibrio phage ICP1_2006_C]ADX88545.1 hypothetical protein TUST1-159_00225 [Vibrio phage ICP1_2006_B]ADX88771.1 hypothetical protein TUST1-17_00225 [Vibrio phage ICP1_2006_A]ADX88997.1 hypothetical protein TUST1-15_00225 [Vibrio phage ICP1_2005_A]ADX89229.1 hypothetical protein TUST1-2_00235 [Vibrio phage ICP1_2001_A
MCKKEKCPNFDKCKCGTPKQVLEGVNTVLGIDHEIKGDNNRYENLTWIPMTTSPHHISNQSSTNEFNLDTIAIAVGEWDYAEKVYNFVPESEVREELGIISYISPLGVFDNQEEEK